MPGFRRTRRVHPDFATGGQAAVLHERTGAAKGKGRKKNVKAQKAKPPKATTAWAADGFTRTKQAAGTSQLVNERRTLARSQFDWNHTKSIDRAETVLQYNCSHKTRAYKELLTAAISTNENLRALSNVEIDTKKGNKRVIEVMTDAVVSGDRDKQMDFRAELKELMRETDPNRPGKSRLAKGKREKVLNYYDRLIGYPTPKRLTSWARRLQKEGISSNDMADFLASSPTFAVPGHEDLRDFVASALVSGRNRKEALRITRIMMDDLPTLTPAERTETTKLIETLVRR